MKHSLNIIVGMLLGSLLSAQGSMVLEYDATTLDLSANAQGAVWTSSGSESSTDLNAIFGAGSSIVTPSSAYFTRAVKNPNSAQFQTFKNSVSPGATADFSFELWVKPANLTGDKILFETGGATIGTSILLVDDTVHFVYSSGGSPVNDVTGTLSAVPSEFIQIVGVIDVSNGMNLYIDGVEVGNGTTPVGNWAGASNSQFGGTEANYAKPAGLTAIPFAGEMALARFYDTALTSTEVATAFSAIPEPGTLGLITAFGGTLLFIRRRLLL